MQLIYHRLQGVVCEAIAIVNNRATLVDEFLLSAGIFAPADSDCPVMRAHQILQNQHQENEPAFLETLGAVLFALYMDDSSFRNADVYRVIKKIDRILEEADLEYIPGGHLRPGRTEQSSTKVVEAGLNSVIPELNKFGIAAELIQGAADSVESYIWLFITENELRYFLLLLVNETDLPKSITMKISKSIKKEKDEGWIPLRARSSLEHLYLSDIATLFDTFKDRLSYGIVNYSGFVNMIRNTNQLRRQVMHSCFISREMQTQIQVECGRLLSVLQQARANYTNQVATNRIPI